MLAPKIPMRKYLSSARMGRRITSQRRLTVQIDRRQPRANNFVLIRCGQLSSQLTPQCSGVPSTSACGSNLADLLSYKKSGSIQSQSWLVEPMTVLSSQHDATSNSLSTNPSWFFNSDLLNSRCLVVFHPTITPTLFVTHSNERPKLNDGVKMSQKEVTNRSPSEPVGKFPEGKPNWTQLEHIVNRLTLTLPYFFSQRQDFSFYRDDVVLENRINGVIVKGTNSLWYNFATIRTLATLRYVFVELQPLNISAIMEEGVVKVRWRVLRLGFIRTLLLWPKLGLRNWSKELLRRESDWFDGLANFHVDCDGLVYRVVLDRMDVDRDKAVKPAVVRKLAGNIT